MSSDILVAIPKLSIKYDNYNSNDIYAFTFGDILRSLLNLKYI